MRLRTTALAALALLLIASASVASTVRLSVGDRVRITARSVAPKPMIGRIVYGDLLQVTIALDGGKGDSAEVTRGVAWESIDQIQRSLGKRSSVRRTALEGAAVGFALGALFHAAADDDADHPSFLTYSLGGAAAFGILGASLGLYLSNEKWEQLPLDSRVGLRFGAPSTSLALGIRTHF